MFMPRFHPRALLLLLVLAFPGVLKAQVEPELVTQTDLLDVYKSDAGTSQLTAVLDFSTLSRGIFEPSIYLSSGDRGYHLGNYPLPGIRGKKVGNDAATITQGKDYGFIFLLRKGTTEVYLYRWAQSKDFYTGSGFANVFATSGANAALRGTPLDFRGSWTSTAVAYTSDADTLAKTTHVRFSVGGRTVDLPCPSTIWDSPYTAAVPDEQNPNGTKPINPASSNYQKNKLGSTDISYDSWSDTQLSGFDPSSNAIIKGIPDGFIPMGNFFYSFDYFCWIFNSTEISTDGFCFSPAPKTGPYASTAGYAVAQTTETVTIPGGAPLGATATGLAVGWANGLPNMTRYQAQKVANANVFMNKGGAINWVYRFLDGRIDNPSDSEEGGTAFSKAGPGTKNPKQEDIWNDTSVKNRKFIRKLTSNDTDGLKTNLTSLQMMGPSGWTQSYGANPTYQAMNDFIEQSGNQNVLSYDGGTTDPRTPQPWGYALANTYWRSIIEANSEDGKDLGIYETKNSACPGKNYVIIFPTAGFSDSTSTGTPTSILQDAAAVYGNKTGAIPSGNGNGVSPLNGGSFHANGKLPSTTEWNLAPNQISFHPAVLASVAAFGDSSGNGLNWGAAWEADPSQARGQSKNPGTQSMVMSVGIPGSVYCGSSHNLRSAAAQFFRVAQWSDPTRKVPGYSKWAPDKPGDDAPKTAGGKVHYYPSGSPAQLEANLETAVAYIVAGSAALSAPATPSTGARTTTQAYFGVFNTATTPVWSGDLYSVGIRRKVDATTNKEVFSFYGGSGESTIDSIWVADPTGALNADGTPKQIEIKNIDDFQAHHLWSAFDVFHNYDATDLKNQINASQTPTGTLGTPLTWDKRTIYTLDGSTMVDFKVGVAATKTLIKAKLASLSPIPTDTQVNNFINFIRGRHQTDATKNRINLFGDIINSAPLGVELSKDNVLDMPSGVEWPTTGSDPHMRLILVGSNSGMLHAFVEKASLLPNVTYGDSVKAEATEAWAFIPPDAIKTMYMSYAYLYETGFSTAYPSAVRHPYLVDGNPVLFHEDLAPSGQLIGDTRVSKGETGLVIFGLRKGGRSYYALGISGAKGTPGKPAFLWKLDPLDTANSAAVSAGVLTKLGMSTPNPTFNYITDDGTIATREPAVFIPGGYANDQINANYRGKGTLAAGEGLGKSLLALNPLTGKSLREWNWASTASLGAIAAGVTPVRVFSSTSVIHRVYMADFKGNVFVVDSDTAAKNVSFRADTSALPKWRETPRFIYKNDKVRFTTRPEAFVLSANYPVAIFDSDADGKPDVKPLTVMVSAGSGDWNNPTDKSEAYTSLLGSLSGNPTIPPNNFMYVFADRQDSKDIGSRDTGGIKDPDELQEITDNTSGATTWATSYADSKVTIGHDDYLFKNKSGYYYSLLTGSMGSRTTYDKVLVSPLIKEGSLFFSLYSITGNTGFGCSPNSFTRTFRECDILRPLAIKSQVQEVSTVADVTDLNRSKDDCSGLAFFFNSLSSELADTGDRVVQGGAVTSADRSAPNWSTQVGANTPTLQTVKDTSAKRGFKLRTWRVVR